MKILLVDDHVLVREGFQYVLRCFDPEAMSFEATDCAQALQIAAEHDDLDLVLLDLAMPGVSGLNALEALRDQIPATPIVMLSAHEDSVTVMGALQRGAKGYIPKSSTKEVMLSALQLVLAGGIYLPPTLLDQQQVSLTNGSKRDLPTKTESAVQAAELGLTPRQSEVLALLIEGKPNKEISRMLNLSAATVRAHVAAILRVLNVSNRTEAGYAAYRRGLI